MCTPCEMNTYQDTPGQASCKPCSANTYSNITASTSSSNCISKKISYSKISPAVPVNLYILIICLIIVHLLVFLLSFIYSINHTNNCFSKVILIRFGDGWLDVKQHCKTVSFIHWLVPVGEGSIWIDTAANKTSREACIEIWWTGHELNDLYPFLHTPKPFH